MSPSKRPPPGAVAFIKRWVELFHQRDWRGLTAFQHPDFPESGPPGMNDTHVRSIGEYGGKVVRWTLAPYQAPKWPILREYRFHPAPSWWSYLTIEYSDGNSTQIFLALASAGTKKTSFRASYYVPIERKKKIAPLDLGKETVCVAKFLKNAVRLFAKKKVNRSVQLLELSYSPDQGLLQLSLDVNSAEPGRAEAMSHYAFNQLLVPHWAEVAEKEKGSDAIIARLGRMLVKALKSMRAQGHFDILAPTPTSEMGVAEIEGRFGWPAYEKRGKQNQLARLVSRARRPRNKRIIGGQKHRRSKRP